MTRIRAIALFWWEFVVGDDWFSAAAVVAAIAITDLLSHRHIASWWVLVVAVPVVLYVSLRRAITR